MKKYFVLGLFIFPLSSFALFESLFLWKVENPPINVSGVIFVISGISILLLVRAIFLKFKYKNKENTQGEKNRLIKSIIFFLVWVVILGVLATVRASFSISS